MLSVDENPTAKYIVLPISKAMTVNVTVPSSTFHANVTFIFSAAFSYVLPVQT